MTRNATTQKVIETVNELLQTGETGQVLDCNTSTASTKSYSFPVLDWETAWKSLPNCVVTSAISNACNDAKIRKGAQHCELLENPNGGAATDCQNFTLEASQITCAKCLPGDRCCDSKVFGPRITCNVNGVVRINVRVLPDNSCEYSCSAQLHS